MGKASSIILPILSFLSFTLTLLKGMKQETRVVKGDIYPWFSYNNGVYIAQTEGNSIIGFL
jgi:hypothetical protein